MPFVVEEVKQPVVITAIYDGSQTGHDDDICGSHARPRPNTVMSESDPPSTAILAGRKTCYEVMSASESDPSVRVDSRRERLALTSAGAWRNFGSARGLALANASTPDHGHGGLLRLSFLERTFWWHVSANGSAFVAGVARPVG